MIDAAISWSSIDDHVSWLTMHLEQNDIEESSFKYSVYVAQFPMLFKKQIGIGRFIKNTYNKLLGDEMNVLPYKLEINMEVFSAIEKKIQNLYPDIDISFNDNHINNNVMPYLEYCFSKM